MGRRSGIGILVTAIARAQRASVAAQKRAAREDARAHRAHARALRQYERAHAAYTREMEREAKRQYLEDQAEAAEDQTAALAAVVDSIDAVLSQTLAVDDRLSFDALRLPATYPPFVPPADLVNRHPEPQRDTYLSAVQPPGFFSRLLPGSEARYQEALRLAEARYAAAASEHQSAEQARVCALNAAYEAYEVQKAEALAQANSRNAEIDEFQAAYVRGEVDAILAYNTMVLERSDYPVEMPQTFRLEYDPETRDLLIDYELPDASVVPATVEVRYVKSKDTFEEKPRKASEIRERHQKLVAAIALRTIHEVFEADQANHLAFVTFTGFVNTIDPATGQNIRPYAVSIRAARDEFVAIDLARVAPAECVRRFALGIRNQVAVNATARVRRAPRS
jgi:restriction system protein